jgi:hypothetical protein
MTQKDNLASSPLTSATLIKRMLLGAAIALTVIIIFLAGAGDANPNWPRFWMLKPLLVVPTAGAMGGLFHHFMGQLRSQGGWKKALAFFLSLFGYGVALWMGIVLGLNGTYWN